MFGVYIINNSTTTFIHTPHTHNKGGSTHWMFSVYGLYPCCECECECVIECVNGCGSRRIDIIISGVLKGLMCP